MRLVDPNFDSVQPDDKVALTMSVCEEIMGKDDRIISANASYSDEKDFKYMVASNGFEGEASGSSYGLVGSVSIRGEGDARPESYWYDSSLYYDELVKTGIGTKALERVLRKLGQRKVASGKYTMIVDNMNSSRLLSPVIGAIYGSSIQQKNSFLLDKIDQKVASDKMTLIDEPHLVKASGARYFDSEGVATKRLPVFEQGILKTYYIDYGLGKLTIPTSIVILILGIFAGIANNGNQFMVSTSATEAPDFANGLFLTAANLGTTLGTAICGMFITVWGTQSSPLGAVAFLLVGVASIIIRNSLMSRNKHIMAVTI